MSEREVYWALQDDQKLANSMKEKMDEWDKYLEDIGRIERLRKSWEFLNGLTEGGSGLRRGGKAGEIVRVGVNNYRAFANNIHVLLTQAKSYFEVQADTMDFGAQAECVLGKSIADHYVDEARIGAKFSMGVYLALGNGEEFMELDWDEGKGQEIAVDPGTKNFVRGGDITARLHNTMNVGRDIHQKTPENNRWWTVRDWIDKFELAAIHPDHAEHILQQKGPEGEGNYRGRSSVYQKIRGATSGCGDNIEILKLYHDKTRACPQGVEALSVGGKIIYRVTIDENYGELPIKRLAAGDIEGSVLPYSPLWDLIPLCEAADFLTTAAITNAMNLAFTNIWSQDPNLRMEQLTGALGKITSATKPEALNLAQNSPEIQRQLDMLHQKSQFLTGINSVAAGQPEAVQNVKSGNGLALILSTAVQFQNVVQERYAEWRSECMGLLIRILQKKANSPMLIAIAGKGKASYAKAFQKKDIQSIRRIKCIVGSPIMATIGGRMQVADNLAAKYPNQVSVSQYISVLQTGNLDYIEAKTFNESMALVAENEALSSGKKVPVNILEKHPLHIMEHIATISTPEAKQNPKLLKAITDHVMEHFHQWNDITINFPALLQLLQIPPLQGIPPGFAGGANPAIGGGQQGIPEPGGPTDAGEGPQISPQMEPRLPSMPKLPAAAPEGLGASYDQVNTPPMETAG